MRVSPQMTSVRFEPQTELAHLLIRQLEAREKTV